MTVVDYLEVAARAFEPGRHRHPTPGALARVVNPRTVDTPALRAIDQALVELSQTPDGRLIVCMPPQEGKSVRVSGDFPTWLLQQNPDRRVVVASYGKDLATRNGRAIRNRITGHPTLGLTLAPDQGAAHEWTIAGREGGVLSVGIGSGLTGRPADCVGAETHIESDHGRITAAEAFTRGITRILAYDHTTRRPVWRRVEAARRIPGRRVVDVVTRSGRVLTCTPDHRVYTRRGYVPAGSLRPGDALVAVVAARGMPVRESAGGAEDGRPQSGATRTSPVLPPAVHGRSVRGGESDSALRVWGTYPTKPEADLLHAMSKGTHGAADEGMPTLRGRLPTPVNADDVLLPPMRQRRALGADDRGRQLALPDGHQLRALVPVDASADPRAGRTPMRGLRRSSDADIRTQRADCHPLRAGGAPHRRGRDEQPPGEPHNPVPHVSPGAPQVGDDTVSLVRSRGSETVDVYDFQVEGVRNFFGSGVLVHNCLVIDDPIKDRTEADSKTYRDRAWDWWTEVARTRLAPGAPVVLVLTRWHHDDLAGRLLAQDAAGDGDGWSVLTIPAEADHHPENGETDPLGRQPGEFMVSARGRTPTQWERIKRGAGARTWAALYQGKPSPDEGSLFLAEWWQEWDTPPYVVAPNGVRYVPEASHSREIELCQSWDMAFKDKDTSDFVVGQVWLRRGVDAYLLEQVRGRWSFTETCRQVKALSRRWPQAVAKLVEDAANGPAVMNALRATVAGLIPVTPEGSKYARAAAISPLVQSGNVLLPPDDPEADQLVEEAKAFPHGANDDQVDALSQALHRLLLVPMFSGDLVEDDDFLDDDVDDYAIAPA